MGVVQAIVTQQPLQPQQLLACIAAPAHGAEVLFVGTIRDHDEDRPVLTLEYEIHPSANDVLATLAHEVAADHPEVVLAVAHRFGPVAIGEPAFVVAAGSAHRGPAFAAASELVETVKARLPIWKRQTYADGTYAWVNSA
jgi:molybdopterin synthase catalytic subunit